MKTITASSLIVIEGKIHEPGSTVTAEESVLKPFVDLSLASWVLESTLEGADKVLPEVKLPEADDHAG